MKEILIDLLKTHALKHGDFILSSGKKSSYYLDVRQVTLRSRGADVIAQLINEVITCDLSLENYAVGGMSIGADPIVGALLVNAAEMGEDLLGFIVRKETKDHGTKQLVEGPLEVGMSVVIVEDVATTGASALKAVDAVLAMTCHVEVIIAVVDRLEGAVEACTARGIPFKSLVTIRDLGITP
jgi:orotate phosphoribosyltransferase